MFFNESSLSKTRYARLSSLYSIDDFANKYSEKDYQLFSDDELIAKAGQILVFDCESYINYFLVAFKSPDCKRVVYFEDSCDEQINLDKLRWVVQHFCIVGFNSKLYDMVVTSAALTGHRAPKIKEVTNDIIFRDLKPQHFPFEIVTANHVDLIGVAPLQASLKLYGGRLHSRRMQELPIPHDRALTKEEARLVRLYCINDLDLTADLLFDLKPQLELRNQMSVEYRQDLRSKSDAQIAEAVITTELKRINGFWTKKPDIEPGTTYKYKVPEFIKYESPELNRILQIVSSADLCVSVFGGVEMPKEIADLNIKIGQSTYRMGIGGLHSSEKCVANISDEKTLLIDRDVASYYPAIILNLGLYPKHLGKNFLTVYRSIVQRRLEAKKAGNKVVNESLKITINGSFGKLGNMYSALYAPDLLIQVTVTGQLALLMLIEMIEFVGATVVSANTDGVLVKCDKERYTYVEAQIIYWERLTGFQTEETRYKAVYSRDVNNYIAVKESGECKVKGAYTEKGSSGNTVLSKNPEMLISIDAVVAFLSKGVPIEKTITECKDIRRFVSIRNVKGGAEKNGSFLGRAVRWYYSTKIKGTINYITTGNKVPNTDNAMPLMDLPDELPQDVDYDHYIKKAYSILHEIGYYPANRPIEVSLF